MTPDELTRLREEVARLTRERDAAEAIIGAHRWSRSGIQAELARLRAAIAPTDENVEALARVIFEADHIHSACGYLAANGMTEYGTDQSANFCLGHVATFGMRVAERFATDRDAVLEEAVAACEPLLEHHVARLCIDAIRALRATPAPITPSAVSGATLSDAQLRAIAECARIHWTDPRLPQLVALIQGIGVPSAVDEAERRGAERERAAVVAWLRSRAKRLRRGADIAPLGSEQRYRWKNMADSYDRNAACIEAGRHIPPATESEAGRG